MGTAPGSLTAESDSTVAVPSWRDDRAGLRTLFVVGLATLLALAAPAAWVTLQPEAPGLANASTLTAWWVSFSVFTLAWVLSALWRRAPAVVRLLLLVQTLAALAANWLLPTVFSGVAITGLLLMMVAAQLAVLRPLTAYAWIALQTIALFAIYHDAAWPAHISLSAAGAYGAGQLAMLAIGRMAERQRILRVALAETLSELRATQALLEESVRSAERTRIARELHDLLGHHLVAMRLQLESAALEPGAPEPMRRRVSDAAAVARLLLSDVRAAVADLRESASIDLVAALRHLAHGVEGSAGPTIALRVDERFDAGEPARAAAFLRCAQEAVTNARRHAGASRLEIELRGDTLCVRDDGRGLPSSGLAGGSGLRGMRERVEALGGAIELRSPPGGGLEVRITIPHRLPPPVPSVAHLAPAAPVPTEAPT